MFKVSASRVAALTLFACVFGVSSSISASSSSIERGEYLASIMDCTGCHTPGTLMGQPDFGRLLGGSDIGFLIPGLGVFYPPNLTSDNETGLGTWTVEEIATAVRNGIRPDGRELAPAMPWQSYSVLNDEDAAALADYLKSLPVVRHAVPGPFGPEQSPTAPYLSVIMP